MWAYIFTPLGFKDQMGFYVQHSLGFSFVFAKSSINNAVLHV